MGIVENTLVNIENLGIEVGKKQKGRLGDRLNEKRDDLYIELAEIIRLFPARTPAEILDSLNTDTPCFHGNYDSVTDILNIKIDDAIHNRLKYAKCRQDKYDIEIEVENWRYIIEKIKENKKAFENANALYEKYKNNHSGSIEIVFSQEVKNELTKFDVFLSNAFGMPGRLVEEDDVRAIMDRFIFAMRQDVGAL